MATQAERSVKTTERLLSATLASVVERGYRGTSTPEVCRRAGVSRGAQLHHYPTKEALVAAAVEHLIAMRLAEIQERLERARGVLDLHDVADFLLNVYTGDSYYAWLELLVAARTDPPLRKLMARLDERLVASAEALVASFLLPYAKDDERRVRATTRLILAIFDGLGAHQILCSDNSVARDALRLAKESGLFTPKGKDA